MESSANANSDDVYRGASSSSPTNPNSSSARYGLPFTASNLINSQLSTFLEYSGLLRSRSNTNSDISLSAGYRDHSRATPRTDDSGPSTVGNGGRDGEVSIRIIGAAEQENDRSGASSPSPTFGQAATAAQHEALIPPVSRAASAPSVVSSLHGRGDSRTDPRVAEREPQSVNASPSTERPDGLGVNHNTGSYQRYDIQQAARGIEQVLPFSLLLLVVFIRQHLQGFFVTIWLGAFTVMSNDILRKQTALKGERKILVLFGISLLLTLHVAGLYWWYWNDELWYPLVMIPPKAIPPFWNAIFIIVVNDILVRQAAMVLKCILLVYYKNGRGRNYRKQGQMLTVVEYLLRLYRSLLPAPVWYRFFLDKEYGSLFSSLMTGLYLTFKLTSVVEKVQSFLAALKALSRKEIHYGTYATSEQVTAAGDLCAICQEKMQAPILLRCKHIFCEDCVDEWFERERTCPLCRALVKPADLRSFGDGSTGLFFHLF